jgi:hypothetical protein
MPACVAVSRLNCSTKAFQTGNAGIASLWDDARRRPVLIRLGLMRHIVARRGTELLKVCGKFSERFSPYEHGLAAPRRASPRRGQLGKHLAGA